MCYCSQNKLINTYEPRLLPIENGDRWLKFKVEGSDLEGICMSTNSLIRYSKEELVSFSDWALVVMCKINENKLEIVNTLNLQTSKNLSWVEKEEYDFIFAFKSDNKYDNSFTNKDGKRLARNVNINYSNAEIKDVVEDFKFSLASGAYNWLVK
jgi:hypothetical protein